MNNTNKPKIINLIPHGPAYGFSPDEKPDVWWEKSDGSWLGFWTREWPDLLGESVRKAGDQYDWEVWQPDYRADRNYSKELNTGVVHRLFPAKLKVYRPGIRSQNGFFSEDMILRLKKIQDTPIILTLYNTYGFHTPFFIEILKLFGQSTKFPVFFLGLGMFKSPASEIIGMHRPLTYLCLLVELCRQKKLLKYIDVISEQNKSALREVRRVYSGRIEKLTMGCNFEFWVPVPSKELKKSIRNRLNIPQEKKVFFASGNFIPRKQFDKLLEVFKGIQKRDDFFIIIAGHGDETHSKILMSLATSLIKQRKAMLHPYVRGEKLRNLHWASDLYISVSTDEGASVSIMEAMACGLPIITTSVGETSDRMKKYGVGKFVPVKNYDEWVNAIIEILDNKIPKSLDIQIAKEAYDWPNVARRFINVYHDLYKRYYLNP